MQHPVWQVWLEPLQQPGKTFSTHLLAVLQSCSSRAELLTSGAETQARRQQQAHMLPSCCLSSAHLAGRGVLLSAWPLGRASRPRRQHQRSCAHCMLWVSRQGGDQHWELPLHLPCKQQVGAQSAMWLDCGSSPGMQLKAQAAVFSSAQFSDRNLQIAPVGTR